MKLHVDFIYLLIFHVLVKIFLSKNYAHAAFLVSHPHPPGSSISRGVPWSRLWLWDLPSPSVLSSRPSPLSSLASRVWVTHKGPAWKEKMKMPGCYSVPSPWAQCPSTEEDLISWIVKETPIERMREYDFWPFEWSHPSDENVEWCLVSSRCGTRRGLLSALMGKYNVMRLSERQTASVKLINARARHWKDYYADIDTGLPRLVYVNISNIKEMKKKRRRMKHLKQPR